MAEGYFQFTLKDPEHCRQWVKAAKNHNYGENTTIEKLKNLCVCSLHFKLDDNEQFLVVKREKEKSIFQYGKYSIFTIML